MTARSALKTVARVYNWFLILMVTMMFVVVAINVFSRYVLNASLGWADELARFLFIYVSLLGAVVAYHDNEHVALDFVVVRIPSAWLQTFVRLIAQVLVVGALAVFTSSSWMVASSARNVSPALYIPMSVVYGVMPVGGGLMFLLSIVKCWAILTGRDVLDAHAVEAAAAAMAEQARQDAAVHAANGEGR